MKKIKRIFLVYILAHIALGFRITTQLQILLNSDKKLSVQNAVGAVKYRAENLPDGIALEGDTIKIKDRAKLTNGYYPIRINVQDSQGSEDDQLVLLLVQKSQISPESTTSLLKNESLNYQTNPNNTQQNNEKISNQSQLVQNIKKETTNDFQTQLNSNQKFNNNFENEINKILPTHNFTESSLKNSEFQSLNVKNQTQSLNLRDSYNKANIINSQDSSNNQSNLNHVINSSISTNKIIKQSFIQSTQVTTSLVQTSLAFPYGNISPLKQTSGLSNLVNQYTNMKQISLSLDQGLDLLDNYAPIITQSQKLLTSKSNQNQINGEDTVIASALQRQLNAVKTLANLLQLVRQATANRNVAKDQISKRESLLTEAKNNQRQNILLIQKYKNNLNSLKKQLQLVNSQSNGFRRKIQDIKIKGNIIDLNRQSTQQKLTQIKKKYNSLIGIIENKNNELSNQSLTFGSVQMNCKKINDQILNANKLKRELIANQSNLTAHKQILLKQVGEQQKQVNDLKKKLMEAQQKLKKKQNQFGAVSANLNQIAANIDINIKRIDDASVEQRICETKIQYQGRIVDKIKSSDLKLLAEQKGKSQEDINAQNKKINEYNKQQAQLISQSKDYQNKIQSNNKKIVELQNKIYALQLASNKAQSETLNYNDQVIKAQQNLGATNQRYLNEGIIIQQNTKYIENARIQKSLADEAVDKLLKSNADVLSFSAAPENQGQGAAITIDNWSDYLQWQYGIDNSKPIFNGDIKTLYSFKYQDSSLKPLKNNSPNLYQFNGKNKNCLTSTDSTFGYIYKIDENRIDIMDSVGKKYTIRALPCIKLFSNKPQYKVGLGDLALAKGTKFDNNSFQASSLTFIRQW